MTAAIVGGIVGTAVMTGFMMVSPALGFPEVNPAEMMAGMMEIPIVAGWGIHFIVGIVFALGFAVLIINWLENISSNILKGVIFGLIAWVVAQSAFMGMGAVTQALPGPPPEGIAMMMTGSALNHIVFGIVVTMFVKLEK